MTPQSCGAIPRRRPIRNDQAMSAPPAASRRSATALRPYLYTVITIGTLVFVAAGVGTARAPYPLAWMALAALALVSAWFRLNFKSVSATVGIDDTFCITAALLFGPGPATL